MWARKFARINLKTNIKSKTAVVWKDGLVCCRKIAPLKSQKTSAYVRYCVPLVEAREQGADTFDKSNFSIRYAITAKV